MAILDGHKILVERENFAGSVEAPEHPVEEGIALTDHVEPIPIMLSLEGRILGPDAADIRDQLHSAMRSGKIISYSGRNAMRDALITSFDSDHDANVANGYIFHATVKELRIAKPSTPEPKGVAKQSVKVMSSLGMQQTQNKAKPPIFHLIRKGQTFFGIAPKYGTSWPAIKALNPGVNPNALQIGQKVRVI